MQQEDEEAGDVVVGVGVQSQIDETVHAVRGAAEWQNLLRNSRSPISISLQRRDTHETLQAIRLLDFWTSSHEVALWMNGRSKRSEDENRRRRIFRWISGTPRGGFQ